MLRSLFVGAFVLSSGPAVVWAAEPSLVEWTRRRVEEAIVKPLEQAQGKRFSRARPPPRERRVRVTQSTAMRDARGRAFVPFAVDVRFGSEWQRDDVVGCVYRENGDVFVKRGDAHRPAAFLLGKNAQAVAGACTAAPARS
jgi:hypothetical protein